MTTTILTFTGNRMSHPSTRKQAAGDNIVSLEAWRGRTRLHRTASGVFFRTNVLCTTGEVA